MKNDLHPTASDATASGDAVRAAPNRRAAGRPADRSETPAGAPAKLRGWSVAELIARAVPRPPAGGLAH